ncbi:MAG: YgiQ family radical SAM protein [Verrucomicrobia bacterium]|nr:YgiQ family radical SAM protein [Verrucomicrobiota bacterium]MBU1733673.1 YgiQ family radical SAM protein [Verrucomicrobiota bacterium]MBU1856113.1 YgiQ family radical SAM protein [Verrucomicrobiota bacterium]
MAQDVIPITDPRWRIQSAASHGPSTPLPMTRHEMDQRGWDACDIVLITGDAYVDHPSFGAALVGRWLEYLGYRVGIIAQPDPLSIATFRELGKPRLFWGITAGNLDSELANLTIMRKLRRDDPYSPGGRAGRRPRNASIIYTACARHAFKGVPVVLGGVEASLRRFAYYDYWTDRVRRSLLFDAKADIIVYGMAERAMAELAWRAWEGKPWHGIRGTAEYLNTISDLAAVKELPSYENVAAPTPDGRRAFMEMARLIEAETDPQSGGILVQRHGNRWLVAHPPAPPLATEEMDLIYSLPFTHRPHPSYGKDRIPACDMIKDSVTIHRGCYGGCAFCAIGMHQGMTISSRSQKNVLREIERMTRTPDFHGTLSDLGGPTANMYGTGCRHSRSNCRRRSCLYPELCPNMQTDPAAFTKLLQAARQVPGVKHVFVSSGIRYDLALADKSEQWLRELIAHHIGGRLKIAPEHIAERVLRAMRKPAASSYLRFLQRFRELCRDTGKPHDIVEYFISGHPGCTLGNMVELAQYLRQARIQPSQVQDFYPAPLTMAAAMYYTALDPETSQPIYVARTDREKGLQRALLLCHKPEFHRKAREALRAAGRADLIGRGKHCLVPPGKGE